MEGLRSSVLAPLGARTLRRGTALGVGLWVWATVVRRTSVL